MLDGAVVGRNDGVGPEADAIAVSYLRTLADQEERTLRNQYHPLPLPEDIDADLERMRADDSPFGLLRRWKETSIYLRKRTEGLTARGRTAGPAARQALGELTRRVPVPVRLVNGRVIQVTGRSHAALVHLDSHWQAIRALGVHVDRAVRVGAHTRSLAQAGHRPSLRRLDVALEANRALYREVWFQRERLYAHAFTASGAPAADDEPPPAWWEEIQPEDDVTIILALSEAGVGRLGRAAQGRHKRKDYDSDRVGAFGYDSLLAMLDKGAGVAPATYSNHDLGQVVAWLWANELPEEDKE